MKVTCSKFYNFRCVRPSESPLLTNATLPAEPLKFNSPEIFAAGSDCPIVLLPVPRLIRYYSPGPIIPPSGCLLPSQPLPVAEAYCRDHPDKLTAELVGL